jgi:hypothetical protein
VWEAAKLCALIGHFLKVKTVKRTEHNLIIKAFWSLDYIYGNAQYCRTAARNYSTAQNVVLKPCVCVLE